MERSPVQRSNPYVGPHAFQHGQSLYGRDQETRALLDLLIAERMVLLYSPSGAGKTSLIQASLIPSLARRRFRVLPVIQVGHEFPPDFALPPSSNRYVVSTLISLEAEKPPAQRLPLDELANLSLSEYLEHHLDTSDRQVSSSENVVMIFDQFEEIITLEPTDLEARQTFFEHLGEMLENRWLWSLFAMREEYVTRLDPFLDAIPNQLHDTFRLELLQAPAATQAIREPARQAGVPFHDQAIARLVHDLQQVRTLHPDGSLAEVSGLFVEPLQLQVVCYRLWEELAPNKSSIEIADVDQLGNVTTALADYYDEQVARVSQTTRVHERAIRDWFEEALILHRSIRGQVLQGSESQAGLTDATISALVDSRLIRAEERRGALWFELSHDRLIEPVLTSNARWRQLHLSVLQQQAKVWDTQNRPDRLLLRDADLKEAEQSYEGDLSAVEQAFLEQCQAAHDRARRERRTNWLIRLLVVFSLVIMTAAAGLFFFWWSQQRATTRVQTLVLQAQTEFGLDPERGLLLAIEAADEQQSRFVESVLRQAIRESHVRLRLEGHEKELSSVAYSPDGQQIATASWDQTIRLWDASTGDWQATLQGHEGPINAVAFSPDGQQIATASSDQTVRLWDAKTGTPLVILTGYEDIVLGITFNPDGQYIVLASNDGTARVWNIHTVKEELVLQGHESGINSVAFSPDGQRIVTASYDGTAQIWDVHTGKEELVLQGHGENANDDNVLEAVFSPDGQRIATVGVDATMRIWDATTGEELLVIYGHESDVTGVAFSPDGQRIATTSADRTARIWDAETGEAVLVLRGHQDVVLDVAFSPDGQRIVTASKDHTANLWDTEAGKELLALHGHDDEIWSLSFSPDGYRLVSAGKDKTARVWQAPGGNWQDAEDQPSPVLEGHKHGVVQAIFSPDGQKIVTASQDGTARVWDATTGQEQLRLEEHNGHLTGVAFNPDGTSIVTTGYDHMARLWDTTTGELLKVLQGHQSIVGGVAFSPKGDRIVTTSLDATARIWNSLTGVQLHVLRGHVGSVNQAAFSPDGQWIVTAGKDNTARIWDANTGKLQCILRGHRHGVSSAVFSPDGQQVLTASADKTARLWDVSNGQEILVIREQSSGIVSALFSPDGEYIVTAGRDNVIHFSYAQFEDVLNLAKDRVTRTLTSEERQTYLGE